MCACVCFGGGWDGVLHRKMGAAWPAQLLASYAGPTSTVAIKLNRKHKESKKDIFKLAKDMSIYENTSRIT